MNIALINTESRPLISPTLKWSQPESNCLRVSSYGASWEFQDASAQLVNRLLPILDGNRNVAQLSDITGATERSVIDHLQVFAEESYVVDAEAIYQNPSPDAFIEYFYQRCELWAHEIFALPFWQRLRAGQTERQELLGWGIEFFHFIDAANTYMAAAPAYMTSDIPMRHNAVRHYLDEFDHAEIFLDGLVGCGLDRHAVLNAVPLATTKGLIDRLMEIAFQDPLAYAATFAVMQIPRPSRHGASADEQYNALFRAYPNERPLFEAFLKHLKIDIGCGHEELVLAAACRRKDGFSREEIARAHSGARNFVEHMVLFFDGISEYYREPTAMLPRRQIDIVEFL